MRKAKKHKLSLLFSNFAHYTSEFIGSPIIFIVACLFIIGWIASGPIFHYSDTWQLIINTSTTIITFLIVFLLQHTQNRDTEILNLKLDELIKGNSGAKNTVIDLSEMSDDELKELEKAYKTICNKKTGK